MWPDDVKEGDYLELRDGDDFYSGYVEEIIYDGFGLPGALVFRDELTGMWVSAGNLDEFKPNLGKN